MLNVYLLSPVKRASIVIVLLIISGLTGQLYGQFYPIEDATVVTCTGSFVDDGNDPVSGEGGPYTNTSYVFTICPDTPGDVIQVDFAAFSINNPPGPNNEDWLFVFDGNSTSENSLGAYTGTSLSGLAITGTTQNTSGCLTFQFVPANPDGLTTSLPGWEAEISCSTPCDVPTAASVLVSPLVPMTADTVIKVCVGDPVTFDGSGSTANTDFNPWVLEQWQWNFDDGTIDTSGSTVTHSFSEAGEYIINLVVFDDNGCNSLNSSTVPVLVGTITDFSGTTPSEEVCIGDTIPLIGAASGVLWTALPPQVVSGETFLADGAGFAYSSELNFDFFPAGSIMSNCSDLIDVFVNMEHSYMGDLELSIVCPNGTSVILNPYPNNGGGTFIGEAIDDGSIDPGIGWDYSWSPTSTNGTWNDNVPTIGPSLPAGEYESEEDLCQLVGCPLNGTWQFNITDNLAIDNGYIFAWGINFNPALFPDITTFQPIVGQSADSSYWTGPNVVGQSLGGDTLYILPSDTGQYNYTFTAINDFGCQHDTTITITVSELNVDAFVIGGNPILCDGTGNLQVQVGSSPFAPFSYSWTPSTGLSNPNSAITNVNLMQNELTFTATVTSLSTAFCSASDTVTVYLDPSIDAGEDADLFICWNGNTVLLSPGLLNGTPDLGGVWTNSLGNIVTEFDPALGVDQILLYTVTNPVTLCSKTAELSVFVSPIGTAACCTFTLDVEGINISCANLQDGQIIVNVDGQGDPGPFDFVFIDALGNSSTPPPLNTNVSDTLSNLSPGFYQVQVSTSSPDFCPIYDTTEIVEPVGIISGAFPDTSICIGGSANIFATAAGGTGGFIFHWTLPDGSTFDTSPGEVVTIDTLTNSTVYSVITEDINGCFSTEKEGTVTIFPPISINMPDEMQVCWNTPFVLSPDVVSGGIYSSGDPNDVYRYFWFDSSGSPLSSNNDSLSLQLTQEGWYFLSVIDTCSTPMASDSVHIIFYPRPDLNFTSDTTAGCFPVSIDFENLTNPNFIQGSIWNFGDGETSNENNPFHIFANEGTYSVNLTILTPFGCYEDTTHENYIKSNGYPTALFTWSPIKPTLLNSKVKFKNVSSGNAENYWEFRSGDPAFGTSTEANPTFIFPDEKLELYPVFLEVTNAFDCKNSIEIDLTVFEDFLVYFPNSFTPDGDGVNDFFGPKGTDISQVNYSLIIYDRWGKVVFETTDPNQTWNGSVNGGEYYAPTGVYVYHAFVQSASSVERKEYTGNITVIR